MARLSIVIPNWNGKTCLERCLLSLRACGVCHDAEVVVVDNASTDGSPDFVATRFPDVTLLRNARNAGYAPAVNRGVSETSGERILILNSDTEVLPHTLPPLMGFLDAHPAAALVAPRVYRPDGSQQMSSRRRLPTPARFLCQALALHWILPFLRDPYPPLEAARRVEMLDGCCWLVRRDAWEVVGPMDEAFAFYGEDCDWCRRCAEAERQVWFVPEAAIVHAGGASSPETMHWVLFLQGFRARLRYFRKHHGRLGHGICRLALVLLETRRLMVDYVRIVVQPRRYTRILAALRRDRAALRWILSPEQKRTTAREGW